MIEFKIISCPDKSQQATYQHVGRELTFGRLEGEMIIDDPGFGGTQLRVKVESDKSATIECINQEMDIRLNGKNISGSVPLKEKDNLTIARTTINFVRLDLRPIPAPDPYTHPNARERFAPNTKEQTMLDVLDFLEKNSGGSNASATPTDGASPKPPLPGGAKPPLPPGAGAPPPLPKKS